MASGRDPLGKRALFSKSESQLSAERDLADGPDDEDASDAPGPPAGEPDETIEPGGVTVECSECQKTSEVSFLDLGRAAIPLPVFIPFRKYPSLLKCPACNERTWMRVRWST